jgi:hypothetical protein
MKTLDEIDLSLYGFFAFTEEKNNIQIDLMVADGYQPFDDCDLFLIPQGTIIAFKTNSFYGFHNVRITGDKIDYLQLNEVSSLDSVLNEEMVPGYNFYVFCDSKIMPHTYALNDKWTVSRPGMEHAPFMRCDYQKLGAAGFYPAENGYTVTKVFNLLNITGIGHIVRFETSNNRNMNPGSRSDYTAAKTLAGIFKLILEWQTVSKDPFNNQEDIALKSDAFIENLNLDNKVWEDIIAATGDLPLARYIRGNTDRSPVWEDTSISPDSLKEYFKSHCLYPDLYSLSSNLGLDIVDESLINNYLKHFEELLFKYFYDHGIDIELYESLDQICELDTTPEYIKKYIKEYKELKEINL